MSIRANSAGLEANPDKVRRHTDAGRRVYLGDATDLDFYDRLHPHDQPIKMLLVTFSNLTEVLTVVRLLRRIGYTGCIAAIAKYPDQAEEMVAAGVDQPCYLHDQIGIGLASKTRYIEESFTEPD